MEYLALDRKPIPARVAGLLLLPLARGKGKKVDLSLEIVLLLGSGL